MNKYYYKRSKKNSQRFFFRACSLLLCLSGIFIFLYISFPFLSWQLYLAPVFASQEFTAPVPKTSLLQKSSFENLLSQAKDIITVDYTNAQNWFPTIPFKKGSPKIGTYSLSIPKLSLQNASVTTLDTDLSLHLVNYGGTAVPPENGNAVIFGHSTLPQLFNSKDYKTIFANVYTLKTSDTIQISQGGVLYIYRIFEIKVTDPADVSIFEQLYDTSYITLVTCTPPGTTWKRLIVKAKLESI